MRRDPDRSREARALAVLRENYGISQKRLYARSGVNSSTVSAYERGQMKIGSRSLTAMLEAMGYDPRVWQAALRFLAWADHLRDGAGADELPTAEAVAESFGREVERHVVALLRVLRQRATG